MPEKRKRGRPAFVVTPALKRKVSIAAGGGMRHEDIALGLGISRDTLRKHFEVELSVGANMRRIEVVNALHAAAKRGSSSAAKAYLAIEAAVAAPPPEKPAAQPGKKEQQQADALTAAVGTDWESLLKSPGPVQ